MTAELLQVEIGTATPNQILFADHAGDYAGGTGNNVIAKGTPTDVQITLSGVADTEARESAKADLGALFASRYACKVAIEFHTAPTSGEVVQFFWSPSESSSAAVGNDGAATGSDADYTGYDSNLADSLLNLIYIGALTVVNDALVHIMTVGYLEPPSRYGTLVVVNESGQVIAGTDDIETAVALNPIVLQGQDN